MPATRGEDLLDALSSTGSGEARAKLRAYLRRLERIHDLARRMYEHEIALRNYQRGEYRSCVRCTYTFRTRDGAEICPFCLYPQIRPGVRRTQRSVLHEVA